MGMRLASALALVLGVVTFAGPAFAGNGNGNANGGGNGNNGKADSSSATASASGNSADAPGQAKKITPQPLRPSPVAHDTHAPASSTKTKLYGNGKTAGQIAIHNGAPPSTVLHGPGNSQPHKASPCSGGHEVDVHALKSRRHGSTCGSVSRPTGSNGGPEDRPSDPGSSSVTGTTATGSSSDESSAIRSRSKHHSRMTGRESSAVLSAVQRPAGATLPFTGFPLWVGVVLGIVLLALGVALSMLAGRETEPEARP